MSKARSAGRWYSRLALTITKMSTFIGFVGSVSMFVTAVVLGGSLLLAFFLAGGFAVVVVIAYALEQWGFQQEALVEQFDQQAKKLWVKQELFENSVTAMSLRMTDEELVEWLRHWAEELKVEFLFDEGLENVLENLRTLYGDREWFVSKFLNKEGDDSERLHPSD
jgi:hypothetical protein